MQEHVLTLTDNQAYWAIFVTRWIPFRLFAIIQKTYICMVATFSNMLYISTLCALSPFYCTKLFCARENQLDFPQDIFHFLQWYLGESWPDQQKMSKYIDIVIFAAFGTSTQKCCLLPRSSYKSVVGVYPLNTWYTQILSRLQRNTWHLPFQSVSSSQKFNKKVVLLATRLD